MKKLTILFLFVFTLSLPVLAASKWVSLYKGPAKAPAIKLLQSDVKKSVVEIKLPGYFINDLLVNGKDLKSISVPSLNSLNEKGFPELPKINTSLVIPDFKKMDVEILDEEYTDHEIGTLAPSKGVIYRNQDPLKIPFTFDEVFYQSNSFYPENVIQLGAPYVLRDVRGINIQFHPIRYNPEEGTLRICKKIVFAINSVGEDKVNTLKRHTKGAFKIDDSFKSIYDEHFLNAREALADHDIVDSGNMLVITHDAYYDAIKPLVSWKMQKGIPVTVVKVSEIKLDPKAIKAYIQDFYDKKGLTYILLVGDAQHIPPYPGNSGNVSGRESDPSYVLLAGSDNYPDAIISRISAETVDHVKIQVNKALAYEMSPEMAEGTETTYYERAGGIAGDDAGGSPSYTDWERVEMLRKKLLDYKYDEVAQLYHYSTTSQQIFNLLNKGVGYINYINHGSQTSWPVGNFDTTKIATLKNTRWPFIVSVACVNGQFKGATCLAEAFARAGTVDKPAGSVAIYASSTNQSWVPPCVGQSKIVDLVTQEKKQTIGALYYNGVMAVLDDNDGTAAQTYQSWHLFGDGSVPARTKKPVIIEATHGTEILAAEGEFKVDADVADLSVALYADGKIYGTAKTGDKGKANVKYSAIPEEVKNIVITITGFNKVPYVKVIDVIHE